MQLSMSLNGFTSMNLLYEGLDQWSLIVIHFKLCKKFLTSYIGHDVRITSLQ